MTGGMFLSHPNFGVVFESLKFQREFLRNQKFAESKFLSSCSEFSEFWHIECVPPVRDRMENSDIFLWRRKAWLTMLSSRITQRLVKAMLVFKLFLGAD